MIFRARPLHLSEHQRPFWLLVALAIMLLVWVSITMAHAASPLRLAGTLQRDLGALRAQLEQIDPWQDEAGRESVAFNADLADGGLDFHRESMVTILRGAGRRVERLIAAYGEARDEERRRLAESLSYRIYDLSEQVGRLVRATSPATIVALRGEVGVALDRLDRHLALLSSGQAATLPALGSAPLKP
jgi:hypothetical protein